MARNLAINFKGVIATVTWGARTLHTMFTAII
jgi:hypothetical protein